MGSIYKYKPHRLLKVPNVTMLNVFFNYKKTFSMVLLAVCDAQYNFTMLDIGAERSQSDGEIFKSSEIGQRLNNG